MPTPDPVRRQAARTATLVAVPAALAVAAFGLWSAGVFQSTPSPAPTPPAVVPTSPVTMAQRPLKADDAAVCAAVVAKLPATLLGAARRPVTAGPEQNAAYGEPPVTLACGVPPALMAPTELVVNISGVCWFGQVAADGATWTTVDREVPVVVTVPGGADGSGQYVAPLADAVGRNDPALKTFPGGCTG